MNKSTLFMVAGIAGASILIYNLMPSSASCLLPTVKNPKVMLLGDSLTDTGSYCSTVRKILQGKYSSAEVICRAYPGKGVGYIHKAGLEAVKSTKPDVVVLLAGVNDLASGKDVEYITTHLDQFYRDLTALKVPVAAVTLTPWSTHSIGQHLQTQTAQVNAFINRHPAPCAVINSAGLKGQGADGLHLTRAGGENLAKIVIKNTIGVI